MNLDTRLILAVVGGVLGGFFLCVLTRGETPGDRIVATAQRDQSPAVVLIGTDKKVTVLNTETGNPIKDCKTSECKTDVVVSELGEPQLVNRATRKPVDPRNVISIQRVYKWDFELSPGCHRYWPGGEICY